MIQEITTYIIILTSICFTIYNFFKNFIPKNRKSNKTSCSGTCAGCGLSHGNGAKIKFIKTDIVP